MKIVTPINEFEILKSNDLVSLECEQCKKIFKLNKKQVKRAYIKGNESSNRFCTLACSHLSRSKKQSVTCKQCGIVFLKSLFKINTIPNHFCSKKCSGTYNSQHKTYGYRRSKLEKWLEEQLTSLYPNLEIHYNRRDAIKSELDIYFPSLRIAIELNGPFHYEPIYGDNTLLGIQNSDKRKFAACIEKEISLCVINTSEQRFFKPIKSQKYLDIITNIVNERLSLKL